MRPTECLLMYDDFSSFAFNSRIKLRKMMSRGVDLVPTLRPIEGNGRHAVGDLDEQGFVGQGCRQSRYSVKFMAGA